MARLILVEDEMIIAADIQSRLRGTGYDIVGIAATGEGAIAQAGELRPDVVLMDIVLKGEMDGIDAAQQIIERFDIPIIFLTAHTDAATVKRATATASYGFLVKPFEELELRAAIEIAIHRHGTETKARESDRRIRELTESLSEVIFETDKAGNITFVNHAGLKEFGYTKEQVEGKMNLLDLVAPFDRERARETISKRIRGEDRGWVEYDLIKKDGSTVPFAVRTMPIVRDGVYEGLRGIAIDITERKRDEQKLRESERHIREITDALPVVVYEADETGRVTFANATSFDMFGYTKEELEAGMSVFQLIAPADLERARSVFYRRLSGEDMGRVEYTALRKEGSTFPISIRAVPLRRGGIFERWGLSSQGDREACPGAPHFA
jgi:PAS domain S-box-containing protein